MDKVLKEIDKWFLSKSLEIEVFASHDTRLEGWFKGEMLVLLHRLKVDNLINVFEREFSFYHNGKRHQVDFRLQLGSTYHLVELKAPCISQARGTPRNLNFYFREDNVGLLKDFRKLDLAAGIEKWVLAFIYPTPSPQAWAQALARLPIDLTHWHCVTEPGEYPNHIFVSLWSG